MTSVRLPEGIEKKLNKLCRLTHRTKSFYVKEALKCYLEDMEDTYIALERITKSKREFLTSQEVVEHLEE